MPALVASNCTTDEISKFQTHWTAHDPTFVASLRAVHWSAEWDSFSQAKQQSQRPAHRNAVNGAFGPAVCTPKQTACLAPFESTDLCAHNTALLYA